MLSVTQYLPVPRCCSYKLASIGLFLILVLGPRIDSVTATDACNGRCSQFQNVYCNSGTGVCDDCSIYCSNESIFYNQAKCDRLCAKEPVPTDACANRCIDFPDTYCNPVTGSCDSCGIYCSEVSIFYNSTKCAIKCPGRMPASKSTERPVLSKTEDHVSTQTPGIFTTKPATESRNRQTELMIKTMTDSSEKSDMMSVGLFAVIAVFALLIIGLICFTFYRNRRNRTQSGSPHGQPTDEEKKALGTPQEEKRFDGDSEMVVGQRNDTTPLNSLQSSETSLV